MTKGYSKNYTKENKYRMTVKTKGGNRLILRFKDKTHADEFTRNTPNIASTKHLGFVKPTQKKPIKKMNNAWGIPNFGNFRF